MLGLRYSKRTVDSYLYWVRYYIRFNKKRHPAELSAVEVMRFLDSHPEAARGAHTHRGRGPA